VPERGRISALTEGNHSSETPGASSAVLVVRSQLCHLGLQGGNTARLLHLGYVSVLGTPDAETPSLPFLIEQMIRNYR